MDKKYFEPPVIKRMHSGMPGKFGTASRIEPITHIDQVSVDGLMREYGSPLFIISEKKIRETYRKATDAYTPAYSSGGPIKQITSMQYAGSSTRKEPGRRSCQVSNTIRQFAMEWGAGRSCLTGRIKAMQISKKQSIITPIFILTTLMSFIPCSVCPKIQP